MRFRLDHVPARFAEAVAELLDDLTPDERAHLVSLNGSELASLNYSLGAGLREAWSLWDKETPLAIDCQKRGLPAHADDLALAIIEEAWAELCGG